jgi:hypothetical protein
MKKKKKIKSITAMIDEMQMRVEWDFSVRLLLGVDNKEIHGTTNTTVHNR